MPAIRFVIRNYVRSGLSVSFDVVALDENGEVDTAYAGTVDLSAVNSTTPGLPASHVFTADDRGVRSFATTLQTIENVQIFATDALGALAEAGIYIGGAGPDSFTGGDGGDVFDPNGGVNDPLIGGAGEDIFYLTGGINTLTGGDGVDRLIFDLRGNGAGLRNQPGVPIQVDPEGGMRGAFTNDQNASVNFTGIEHITILTNNNAEDNITTGSGDDEYGQVALDSAYYIRDVINLGGGIDRVSVDARATNGTLSFIALNYDGSGEIALYGNGKLGFLNVERFFLQGGNAADYLRGLDDIDRFDGNGGNDTLIGSGGDDDLRGGAGNDVLTGDGRITILLAADNQDNAGSGAPDNDFRVTGAYNSANPAEFTLYAGTANVGIVRLRIRATDVENAAADPAGGEVDEVYVNDILIGTLNQFADNATGDTIFTFDASLIRNGIVNIRIQNVNDPSLGAYEFRIDDVELTVEKTGNDRLDGGSGVDLLVGGGGDDVYVVDDVRDQVQEAEGGGTDTVLSSARWTTLGANVENLAASPVIAPSSATVEALVNTSATGSSQFPYGITPLPDGGYVVCWVDLANGHDAYTRVFNADGSARSGELLVTDGTPGNQGQHGISAVALGNGNFLVATFATGGSGGEQILGRIFSSTGVAQGGEFVLADGIDAYDAFPTMQQLGDGRIALVWQNNLDGGGFGLSYRVLNADGSVGGAPVTFNTTIAGDQREPIMARLDDGRLVVAWESREPGSDVIRARVINADGTPAGDDFVISTQGGDLYRPVITAVEGGGFVVGWEGNGALHARVFDSNLQPLGFQIAVNGTPAATEISGLARMPDGGFMATWATFAPVDGSGLSILGRIFNADGTPRGDDFLINQIGDSYQNSPRIATLADGRIVVTFGSEAFHGGNYDVKQIILDTTPDQTLVGNELANVIIGGRGDDVIAGSGGGDTLTGNQGRDVIIGGEFTGAGPNLIVNGSFETQDGTNDSRAWVLAQGDGTFDGIAYRGTSSIFGWQTSTAFATELNTANGSTAFRPADGTASVNLEYLPGQNQGLYQDIAGLDDDQLYILRFSASMFATGSNYSAVMQVIWNGRVIDTITSETKAPGFYTYVVRAAVDGIGADGSDRLEFREIGSGDGIGTTIDAVSLQLPAQAADMQVGPTGPNLIVNGSFEQRDATTTSRDYTLAGSTDFNGGEPMYRFSDQLLGWGFLPGTTRIEFNTDNPNNPRNEYRTGDGLVGLDLAVAHDGENFGIYQDVTGLADGERYRITISAALPIGPDQTAAIQVIWNGRVVGTVTPTSTTPTDYSFDVYAQAYGAGEDGANRIAFQEVGANGGAARGVVLDNIRLNLVTAADASADTVDYSRESGTGGVVVNLSASSQTVGGTVFESGTARDSFGTIDQLVSIENVITGAANDTVYGDDNANVITTGAGADTVFGLGGDDIFNYNITTDGADTVILGLGADRVLLSGDAGQIRLTFTSAGVGNGNPFDGNIAAGPNVRMQAEDGADGLTGPVSRFDDEGITFVAGAGQTFDVRDFASGAQRGDAFGQVDLGTAGDDVITTGAPGSTVNYYANGGGGADTITTGAGNDFLVGGDGADILRGLAGTDILLGGAGDDVLTGGTGNDAVVGGGGIDRGIVSDAVTLAAFSLLADADPTTAGDQAGWRLTGAIDGTDSLHGVEIVDGSEAGRILLVGNGAFADEAAAMVASTSTADQILFAGNRVTGATEDVTYTLTTRDFGFVDLDGNSSVGVRIATLPPGAAGELRLNGAAVMAGQVIAANAIIAGNLTFVPTLNANGPTGLTFQLTDPASGIVSAQVNTLTLNVSAVNDAPVLTAPATATMNEDNVIAFNGPRQISIADVDVATGAMTVTLGIADGVLSLGSSNGVTVSGSGNALTLTGTLANLNAALATLTYAPPLNANGARTLTVSVSDGGNTGSGGALTDSEAIAITINPVNDAPAGADVVRTINEDASYTFATADFGFTDPVEGNALLAVVLTTVPANGAILLNGVAVSAGAAIAAADIAGGLLRFVPAANANGAGYGNFTFQVRDDGGTSNGGVNTDPSANSFTLNVTAVNDAPVLTAPASATMNEDATLALTGISIADVDALSGTISVTLGIADGVLALGSSAGLTVTGGGNSLTLSGSLANVNAALATLTYAPPLNANGARTLTLTVNDGGNTGSGGALGDSETVAITINPVNDAPAGADAGRTIFEDTSYVFRVTDFPISDVEGNALLEVVLTTVPANGSILLNGMAVAAGTVVTASDIAAGLLRFVPAPDANGIGYGRFTFQVRDNGGTANGGVATDPVANNFTITVTAVDDPSVAASDAASAAENAAITIAVLSNDNDIDGPVPSVGQINGAAASVGVAITLASGATATLNADGTISYDPNGRFDYLVSPATAMATGASNSTALDSFSYTLVSGVSATVTIQVIGIDGANDELRGTAGNDNLAGTDAADRFDLSQGGDDTVSGGPGDDGFFFGSQFSSADTVDGGPGGNDQIGLQGDYATVPLVLGPNTIMGVELVALLPGAGNAYNITTVDANVGAGETLTFYGTLLASGNPFTFDGSAETDGDFRIYGGAGADRITTGQGNDGIYFGPGRFTPGVDHVDGGAGTNDQLALDGNYSITLSGTDIVNIEVVTLLRGPLGDTNSFNITIADDMLAGGETLVVHGVTLVDGAVIDGSQETSGSLRIYGGSGNDTITGGGGADWIFGGNGADQLNGGAGADIFYFDAVVQSTGSAFDSIVGFDAASGDRIDSAGAAPTALGSASGHADAATFNADLAAAIDGNALGAGEAVLFSATSGDMSGRTFVLVDANGVAGYQADEDYVIELVSPTPPLDSPFPFA